MITHVGPIVRSVGVRPAQISQKLSFKSLHDPRILRIDMIVVEKMQETMDKEVRHMKLQRSSEPTGIPGRDLKSNGDVAKMRRGASAEKPAAITRGKGQNIRRLVDLPPKSVQLPHRRIIREQHADLTGDA